VARHRRNWVRRALSTAYTNIAAVAPAVLPAYRWVAHREATPPFARVFARGLHQYIKQLVGDRRNGTFLEAGAHDGLSFSNTAYLERHLGWSGLLIEAIPHKFVECVRNRPRSIVEHCALVSPEYSSPYVELRYAGEMSFTSGASEVDPSGQVEAARQYLLGYEAKLSNQLFLAPARTLAAVIASYGIEHIDLMVLDIEGAELAALKGLDLHRFQIDKILIEVLHNRSAIEALLASQGYELRAEPSFRDALYVRSRSS
jgi:FkbM family methyltransferase